MEIRTTLQRAGLALRGDPPRVTIPVGDGVAEVEASDTPEGTVYLRAAVSGVSGVGDDQLRAVALGAPGDQRFRIEGDSLVAERHLVEPGAGELYDRVHELAKSAYQLAGVLAEIEGLERDVDRDHAALPPHPADPAHPAHPVAPPPPPPAPSPSVESARPAAPPVSRAPEPPAAPPVSRAPEPPAAPPVSRAPEPPPHQPEWFYVDAPTPLLDSGRNIVTVLEPGRWHRLVDVQGDWARAIADSGAEGWIERSRVRQG
jgi:hypothetical protein